MKRIVAPALSAALLLSLAACSPAATTSTAPTPRAALVVTGSDSVAKALRSCGLAPTDEGVDVGSKVALALASEPHGTPTDVDAATTTCALAALGLPAKDQPLLASTLAAGGYQTLQWSGFSATVHVRDTLHFEVDVFAVAR